jgi:hypothetical protein
MIKENEFTIGYDVRFTSPIDTMHKSIERLKEDTEIIMSVDHATWHSLFDMEDFIRPKWTGPRQYLWENLTTLEDFLIQLKPDLSVTIIGVTQFISDDKLNDPKYNYPIIPEKIPKKWKFLGYDVADYYLLSSLSNVLYSGNELTFLKKDFASDLNKYHLFDNIKFAERFRQYSDKNVIEHSPFFVYGIYSKA